MGLLDSLLPARTALLVIDMQDDFLLPEGYVAQAGLNIAPLVATICPIGKLLAVGRAAGGPMRKSARKARSVASSCAAKSGTISWMP